MRELPRVLKTATVFARVISQDNIAVLGIRVQSSTMASSLYAVTSASVPSHNPNTNTDFGVIVALEGAGAEAFNIFDILLDGSDYVSSLIGSYRSTSRASSSSRRCRRRSGRR